jgi:hypothetical protein
MQTPGAPLSDNLKGSWLPPIAVMRIAPKLLSKVLGIDSQPTKVHTDLCVHNTIFVSRSVGCVLLFSFLLSYVM